MSNHFWWKEDEPIFTADGGGFWCVHIYVSQQFGTARTLPEAEPQLLLSCSGFWVGYVLTVNEPVQGSNEDD